MTELMLFDTAKLALEKACSVDEVLKIKDQSAAMAAYARQAKDESLIIKSTELKLRAIRRLGQMMEEGKEDRAQPQDTQFKESTAGTRQNPPENSPKPTLAEMGIGKKLADHARKTAKLSEDEFEHRVIPQSTEKAVKSFHKEPKPTNGNQTKTSEYTLDEFTVTVINKFKDNILSLINNQNIVRITQHRNQISPKVLHATLTTIEEIRKALAQLHKTLAQGESNGTHSSH